MEWLESKDKGLINCVNIKHVLGDLSSAAEGTEVLVKFSSHRYWATIPDLLERQPPKRRRKNKDTGLCKQPPSNAKNKEASKGSMRKTKASNSSASKKSTASKCSVNAANLT